jgi:hypothetical protein
MAKAAKKEKLVEPHDFEAEEMVLGNILLQPEILDTINIDPEAFYNEYFRHIYEAILDLRVQFRPIDRQAVIDLAKEHDFPPALVSSIYNSTYKTGALHDYVNVVNDCLTRRRLLSLGREITNLAYDENTSPQRIVEIFTLKAEAVYALSTAPRNISVKCLRVKRTTPPFYVFEVYGRGKKAVIDFRSGEVLKRGAWVREVTDALQFIPILSKNFFDNVSEQISRAALEEAPDEAKEDKYLLKLVRDFVSSGFQAEDLVDLESRGRPGHVDRKGFRWFKGDAVCDVLKTKTKLDKGGIWNVLSNNEAQKKLIKFKDKPVWLWGMPLGFFQVEEGKEAEEPTLDDIMEEM